MSSTMLSRSLKRTLLDPRWRMPPTFLLPWAASLTTVSHSMVQDTVPPPMASSNQTTHKTKPKSPRPASQKSSPPSPTQQTTVPPPLPSPSSPSTSTSTPLDVSPSLRELLPLLQSQPPHYITVHLHGKHYLVTQGDTVRLPFLMHGVEPGDVLRLNCAINIGSRDYTLKASAPPPPLKSSTTDSRNILDPTTGQATSYSQVMPNPEDSAMSDSPTVQHAPHFIPHIAKGKHSYLDDRLYVCRAVVMGVESEPLRIKEKTKRRQRKVKRVKSKHRFTLLKVKEVRIRSVEEVEDGVGSE